MFSTDKSYIFIQPAVQSDVLTEFDSCLSNLTNILKNSQLDPDAIIKQTIFFNANDQEEYQHLVIQFEKKLRFFYLSQFPPISFVSQPPATQKKCVMEIMLADTRVAGGRLERKVVDDMTYTVIEYAGNRELYAGGLSTAVHPYSTAESARGAFEKMAKILEIEGMTFGDVVRQWNYVEGILDRNSRQNYQIFNDIRSLYYSRGMFRDGYPAATGIGMRVGGVILEFIAVTGQSDVSIYPVKNPLQVNAYSYSQEVLVGPPIQEISRKTSPKFERAKFVKIGKLGQIYISGTAAIRGEESVQDKDAAHQTVITIENIQNLISDANLKGLNIYPDSHPPRVSYLRVYIKKENDVEAVRSVCEEYYPGIPILYLISDICREELLVELEGVALWR